MGLPSSAKEGYGEISPEQAALYERAAVEDQAVAYMMTATVQYVDFVDPQGGMTEVKAAPADRFANVNLSPMVSVAPQPVQGYDLAA